MEIIVFVTKTIGHFTIFVQNKTFYVPFHTFNQIASQVRISPKWYNSHHGTGCIMEKNLFLSTCIHMLCHMHAVLHPHYTSYLVQQDCHSPQEPVTHPCPANTMHMLIFHDIAIVEQCGTHGTVLQHCLETVFVTQIWWITMICWWACTWWSYTRPNKVVALLHTYSEGILPHPL